jgi:hypothetical protein
VRFLQIAFADGTFQSGEMTAVQVVDEIGRAQLKGVALFPHDITAEHKAYTATSKPR